MNYERPPPSREEVIDALADLVRAVKRSIEHRYDNEIRLTPELTSAYHQGVQLLWHIAGRPDGPKLDAVDRENHDD